MKTKYLAISIITSLILVSIYYLYSNIYISKNTDQNRFFEYLELKTLDFRFKIRGQDTKPKDVVIIGIDEKSINNIGKWPWNRSIHAKLIDKLSSAGVKSIGMDISFTEPAISKEMNTYQENMKSALLAYYRDNKIEKSVALDLAKKITAYNTNEDEVFADSLKKAGNVTIGTYNLLNKEDSVLTQDVENNTTYRKSLYGRIDGVVPAMNFMIASGDATFEPFSVYKIIPPIEIIGSACEGVANYEIGKPDLDGTVRKIPAILIEKATSAYFAPLYFMVYLNSKGYSMEKNVLLNIYNSRIELYENAAEKKGLITTISTDKEGFQGLNYYGRGHTFKYISYKDILDGKYNKNDIANKIVLVGYTDTAKGLYDLRTTPFDPNMAGIEIHATAIQNILDDNFVRRFEVWQNFLTMLVLFAIMSLVFLQKKINFITKNILAVAIILGYISLAQLLFIYGIWIDLFYPVFALFILYLVSSISSYFGEESEKKEIKNAFKHYASHDLIDELMKNPDMLKLGGERKQLTVFFSDIQGFTNISEKLDPEKLVDLLNEYLSKMTHIILRKNGMIDKYIGDAIMAVFGAPVYHENHAEMACAAAIEYQKALDTLRTKWSKLGYPEIRARIGINTGDMVVGNMGSDIRFDYTVIGDAVNLASRLEGANSLYGTNLIISGDTYKIVSNQFTARKLDCIRVKGKDLPVDVYELIDYTNNIDIDTKEKLLQYNEGLMLYTSREWKKAYVIFNSLVEKYPNDGPSVLYKERISHFIKNPPPDDWDGIYTFDTK